jgi:hypothetical protein
MTKDEWRLLGYGLLAASLMALFLVPIFLHYKNFPKSLAEVILGVIAFAVLPYPNTWSAVENQTDAVSSA